MKRLRLSDFQVALLVRVRQQQDDGANGCALTSPNSKCALYGRRGPFSTVERVTLHRSIGRLVANEMLQASRPGGRWLLLTDKGRAWLTDNESRASKVEFFAAYEDPSTGCVEYRKQNLLADNETTLARTKRKDTEDEVKPIIGKLKEWGRNPLEGAIDPEAIGEVAVQLEGLFQRSAEDVQTKMRPIVEELKRLRCVHRVEIFPSHLRTVAHELERVFETEEAKAKRLAARDKKLGETRKERDKRLTAQRKKRLENLKKK